MKRIFFVLCCCCFLLCGCEDTTYVEMTKHISEIRKQLFLYQDEEITVQFLSGQREKDYVVDGKNTELVDFGVLSFDFELQSFTAEDEAQYILIIGTRRTDGNLTYNPFDQTFVADIKQQVDPDQKLIAKIIVGNIQKEVTLQCVTQNWNIQAEEALKIVAKEKKKDFDSMLKNGTLQAEIYIKMTKDIETQNQGYYWYVSIIDTKQNRLAYLLDYSTGEIVASN